MPVYVDPSQDYGWRLGPSCHMIADTVEELHEFASRLGLRRAWFQKPGIAPHYDLTESKRAMAVRMGAKEIKSYREFAVLWSKTSPKFEKWAKGFVSK